MMSGNMSGPDGAGNTVAPGLTLRRRAGMNATEGWRIVTINGRLGVLFRGHGLAADRVQTAMDDAFGKQLRGWSRQVEELHLSEQHRVKWCGKHGDPCDLEGEWHTHFHAVRQGIDVSTHFTFAYEFNGAVSGV